LAAIFVYIYSAGDATSKKMVNWSCSSALCYDNFKTREEKGASLKFYRLPSDKAIQANYKSFFKTSGLNWKNGHICCEHWSKGFRENAADLPDIVITERHLDKIKKKYENAKGKYDNQNATKKQKLLLKAGK
jgi:hypothetical protein